MDGRIVRSSRLGYRITAKFVHDFFGRVFDSPSKVFDTAILCPECQSLTAYVEGVDNIVEAQQRVALGYFEDGGIDALCPPLQALVRLMAADPQTADVESPELRAMFTREYLLASEWYQERLRTKQRRDIVLWRRHVDYLSNFLARQSHRDVASRMGITDRLAAARHRLDEVTRPQYLDQLRGTIGADPLSAIPSEVAGRRTESVDGREAVLEPAM